MGAGSGKKGEEPLLETGGGPRGPCSNPDDLDVGRFQVAVDDALFTLSERLVESHPDTRCGAFAGGDDNSRGKVMRAGHASIPTSEPTDAIVMSGPYRFSRNPIYVAMLALHVGVGIWTDSVWFFVHKTRVRRWL